MILDTLAKESLNAEKIHELLKTANQIKVNNQENRDLFVTILQNSSKEIDSLAFFDLIEKALKYSKFKNDFLSEAKLYQILSRQYYKNNQLDSTYKYLVKAEQIYNTLNDSLKSGHLALAKSKILFDNGIFSESEKENLKAIKYLSNTKDFVLIYESNHMMALNLTELFEFQEAKEYFDISSNIIAEIAAKKQLPPNKIDFVQSNINNNLSHLYFHAKDYPNAKKYALKGIYENPSLDSFPTLHSTLLINLLKAKLELNELDNILPQIQEILNLDQNVLTSGLHAGGIPSAYLVKAKYHQLTNDNQKAIQYAKKAYAISNKEKRLQSTKEALAFLSVYDLENQTKNIEKLISLNDSLSALERKTKNKFARIEYQADHLSKLNDKLSWSNQIIILLSCLLVFGFSITIFSVIQYAKNKRLLLRNKNQVANEKIYKLMLEQKELAENAKISERKRIAKELHDGIINRIFTARFHLMQLECAPEQKKEILIRELHQSEDEIRTISHLLNNRISKDSDPFDDLLKNLVSNQENSFSTEFILQMDEEINWDLYNNEQKLNIYRIIQEALQNINKYSGASQAFISLVTIKNNLVRVKIKDNGVGFDKNDPTIKTKGLGLKNMDERAKDLNSNLVIKTTHNQGVTIYFDVKQSKSL
ncbi:sensor histidine kinase [Myroides sp. LJL119]